MKASRTRSCSPRSRVPKRVPICAPTHAADQQHQRQHDIDGVVVYACSTVTLAATKMIWNSEVPGTTEVGMPSM